MWLSACAAAPARPARQIAATPAPADLCVEYTVAPRDGAVSVQVRVGGADESPPLRFPVWVPGDYRVREPAAADARYLLPNASPVAAELVDGVYRPPPGASGDLVFEATVALDGTYRTGRSDAHGLFFHGAVVLPEPIGLAAYPCRVRLEVPDGWTVDAGLASREDAFEAPTYADAIDAVFVAGPRGRDLVLTEPLGSLGRLVLVGGAGRPLPDLVADIAPTLEALCRRLGPPPGGPWLLLLLSDRAPPEAGGLEHVASAAIAVPRPDLLDERRWLWTCYLIAHEFAHRFLGRAIVSAELSRPDLGTPPDPPLLWFQEGFCSYVAWTALVHAGAMPPSGLYTALADALARDAAAAAYDRVSVREASRDVFRRGQGAWGLSYYDRGLLIAWATDAALRASSHGERSLDDALRSLARMGRPIGETDVAGAVAGAGGSAEALLDLVGRAGPLDLAPTASSLGLRLEVEPRARGAPWLGLSTEGGNPYPRVAGVALGGPADRAGLRPGDAILRVGDADLRGRSIGRLGLRADQRVRVSWMRGDEVLSGDIVVGRDPEVRVTLDEDPDAPPSARRLRERWLGR